MCLPSSLADSFDDKLDALTKKGFRVIAFAQKQLTPSTQTLNRDECEKDLEFLGLLWMENHVKDVSADVISQLTQNNIKVKMATGDNILTAISVAQECKIINQNQQVFYATINSGNQIIWKVMQPSFDSVKDNYHSTVDDEIYDLKNENTLNYLSTNMDMKTETINNIFPFKDLALSDYVIAMTG